MDLPRAWALVKKDPKSFLPMRWNSIAVWVDSPIGPPAQGPRYLIRLWDTKMRDPKGNPVYLFSASVIIATGEVVIEDAAAAVLVN